MAIDVAATIAEAQEVLAQVEDVIAITESMARQVGIEARALITEHEVVQAAYDEALTDEVAVMR